ncbi:hypothetical protein A2454_00950 [Candidatus Peribacteria bacterium RIFOXYC2_FULL_55_14]|nr:MAG: Integrase catalytic region [Candidatus Peribacteria bacterium GW2011_GWC2_54_8]KKW42080.1 MAG: Integrase catalytic region [Candidatus Peregrinibacteria bacterium GW2011_GWA2_54_9]OGJ73062.1 MAG: hypothetical protein A2198_02765 [Candidatus Peribacteria bacterium RIFOXYA1_FULL_56_14]OGJ74478.1 MAG: hypothetical protein A2217_01175 [Candidatus Peribacteria bacterium RIFOXYA2_FULL_55_28]OGJ75683.1 MAG: hypothetical protein A2384_03880 [Candidatus Peribacteria bacterium RIFOXYB1_FULL_54_35]
MPLLALLESFLLRKGRDQIQKDREIDQNAKIYYNIYTEVLKHTRNTTLRDVQRMQQRAEYLELSHGAVLRLQWIAFYLTHGKNISVTARHFGIARSTFVRWESRFDPQHPSAMEERPRSPRKVRCPETPAEAIGYIQQYRREQPMISRERICEKLRNEHHIALSSSTVGREIQRHGFFFAQTPSHVQKRRAALQRGLPRSVDERKDQEDASLPESADGAFSFSPQFSV